jgi:hypothetical protein
MRFEVIECRRGMTDDELRQRFGWCFTADRTEEFVLTRLRHEYGASYKFVDCTTDDEGVANDAMMRINSRSHLHDLAMTAEVVRADASPVHVSTRWCVWSDGYVSSGNHTWSPSSDYVRSPPMSLSDDARRLVDQVMRSCSGDPMCGWPAILSIRSITNREVRRVPRREGQIHPARFYRLAADTADGERELWVWVDTTGEDYLMEVSTTLDSVEARAVEIVCLDDAASHAGMLDLDPVQQATVCAREALGREPTPDEITRATGIWGAAWERKSAFRW